MSDHALLDVITDEIRTNTAAEGFVTAFVVIAAFTNNDGETALYTETAEGQRCHETLGLLTFGLAVENQRAVTGDDE